MTAIALEQRAAPIRPLFSFKHLLIVILLVSISLSAHAIYKHAEIAEKIAKCMDENGPYETWMGMGDNKDTFYVPCRFDDGTFGLAVFVKDALGQLHNKTAFIKGNGSYMELVNYLSKFATRVKVFIW